MPLVIVLSNLEIHSKQHKKYKNEFLPTTLLNRYKYILFILALVEIP